MKREITLDEISDGKLYGLNDMVKADCSQCKGCFACCQDMGNSVVLDPLDVYRITKNLSCRTEDLLAEKVELNVVDGIVLPNLNMSGPQKLCGFLNPEKRCSIHSFRPGICRLFPLGRVYGEAGFQYFLQVHECRMEKRAKVKVKNWIDTADLKQYERFIWDWHCYLKELQKQIEESKDEAFSKKVSMDVLRNFYLKPYHQEEGFYKEFYQRLKEAEVNS